MEPSSEIIEANSPIVGSLNAHFNFSQADLCQAIFGDNESQNYWLASEDLNSRGQLALHILLKNLPTPKDFFDEVVKRVPYMQAYHKVANCPIARNIEHQKNFWMINTPAACNLCAGRSLGHKHAVRYTAKCIRCGGDHQEWMKVCDLLLENPESAKETLVRNVELSRLEHYNRVKKLGQAGKLGFWLVNDRPLRHPRKAPGFPSYKDKYKNYTGIRYKQKKFIGIQHGATNPPALKQLLFSDKNLFSIWNKKFRSLLGGQNSQAPKVSTSKFNGSYENRSSPDHGNQNLPPGPQTAQIIINQYHYHNSSAPTTIQYIQPSTHDAQMLVQSLPQSIQNTVMATMVPNLPVQMHNAQQISQGAPPAYRSPFRPLQGDVDGAKLYEQRERAREQRRLELETSEATRVRSDDVPATDAPAPVPMDNNQNSGTPTPPEHYDGTLIRLRSVPRFIPFIF